MVTQKTGYWNTSITDKDGNVLHKDIAHIDMHFDKETGKFANVSTLEMKPSFESTIKTGRVGIPFTLSPTSEDNHE